MDPLIKLLDQLVKGQVGVFDFLVKLLDAQVACLDVYRLTAQVLTGWRATHGLIHLGTSVAAIDENRPAKPIPQGLEYMLAEEAEVVDDSRTWVKLLVKSQSGGCLTA